MEPTLRPGDWLLVDPSAYVARPPYVGELVVARDPRSPGRWLVKRVAAVTAGGELHLVGDHPAHRQESALERVPHELVVGRPWLRYWPLTRFGRIGWAAALTAEPGDRA
jgi:phage repressor protein C with HTH and peptisase S24 domain